jgi:hypothetical protein
MCNQLGLRDEVLPIDVVVAGDPIARHELKSGARRKHQRAQTHRETTEARPLCRIHDGPALPGNDLRTVSTSKASRTPQTWPEVVAVLPADEVRSHLSQLGPFIV